MILLRYFFREVVLNTTAVSVVLLLVMLSTRFVKYLANAAAGNMDTNVVFLLILYRIPDFLQLILPLGLFVALLLVYGKLYLDNEMRVLYAAGISRLQILGFVTLPVIFITLLVAGISLWLSPRTLARVETIYHQQDSRSELDSLKAGQFQPFQDNRGVIFAEKIVDGSTTTNTTATHESVMEQVYIFQQEASQQEGAIPQTNVVITAKSGKQLIDSRGRYLVLDQGYRLKDLEGQKRFEKIDFARYGQRIEARNQNDSPNLQTDALSSALLKASGRRDYQVAWQWRLAVFILVPVVALIAVALGKADARQGRYFKILPAILLYLLYLILLNVVRGRLLSGGIPLLPGFWAVHLLFLLIGVALFNIDKLSMWLSTGRVKLANRNRDSTKPGVDL